MTTPSRTPGIHRALARLAAGDTPGFDDVREAFDEVMAGEATPVLIGALLAGLAARGETAEVVAGAAAALRGAMLRVPLPDGLDPVDTCGTGGGGVTTVNISTAAAILVAAAGVPVAKHGNRSFTSRSGSADVLEQLGISTGLDADAAGRAIAATGFAFLFAPNFHPAMRHVAPVRRELGTRTVMNLVGPLANPAGAGRQIIGVGDFRNAAMMIGSLARLGAVRGMVVHAECGMDEISPTGRTAIFELREGRIEEWLLDPADHGMDSASLAGLEGGEPRENADRIERLFADPREAPDALQRAVILNAAAALYLADDSASFAESVGRAREVLMTGGAAERLAVLRTAMPFRTS